MTDATKDLTNLPTEVPPVRRPRGFAAMDRGLVRAIARMGGTAAHEQGTAHEFTSEEARIAGRKGGQATTAKRRAARAQKNLAETDAFNRSQGE